MATIKHIAVVAELDNGEYRQVQTNAETNKFIIEAIERLQGAVTFDTIPLHGFRFVTTTKPQQA